MTKGDLIEKISGHFDIHQEDSKFFFETLLRKISESLNADENINLNGLAKIKVLKNELEQEINFSLGSGEEFSFNVPEYSKPETSSIDSYFSLSFSKPVIPMTESEKNEFFIPQSPDETKKLIELRVERIIEEVKGNEYQQVLINESNRNEPDYSSLNIDTEEPDENVNQDELLPEDKNILINSIDEESLDDIFPESSDNPEDINNFGTSNEIDDIIALNDNELDNLNIDEELKLKEEEIEQQLNESFLQETKTETEGNAEDEDSAIKEAFSFAEEKRARIESYSKQRSRMGFIFALIALVVLGAVIYLTYYFTEESKTLQSVSINNEEVQNFQVIVERDFDVPVTYPYQSGMFTAFSSLNPALLVKKLPVENVIITDAAQNVLERIDEVEIRQSVPAVRVKGYIYKYENGIYAVQMSSWKSKSVAVSETKKYLSAGHQAYMERTSLSEGIYYRVRVGGFGSLEDAEQFLKNN